MIKSLITDNIKLCNKGEGFFKLLLSEYAILHQVKGGNDIGIDYFCEWINKNQSSNILFAIQLKTTISRNIKLKRIGNNQRLNQLNQYEIKRKNGNDFDNKSAIKVRTIEYWKGFEIPVFLFLAVISNSSGSNQLFYKRYTPILHGTQKRNNEKFHLVSENNFFLAHKNNRKGGFCRDLFIDYVRCNYKKGSLVYKSPNDFNLNQFNENDFYKDLFKMNVYKNAFLKTRDKLNIFVSKGGTSHFEIHKKLQQRKKI